jgi:RimJ/RimL family protein N-acetyltransferase
MWADPRVVKYIGGKPSSGHQSWLRMLRYFGLWELLGYGFWAVEERASGRFIGELGFADFKRELEPSIEGFPEIGWALAPDAHGKGYATEALRAAVDWGDRYFAWPRTVCVIEPGNLPSLRVAAKLGYTECAKTSINGSPILLFERKA